MARASKRIGIFLVSRWYNWLPPIIVVGIVVIALVRFTPHQVSETFQYKLF
jgi:hypothetical protein